MPTPQAGETGVGTAKLAHQWKSPCPCPQKVGSKPQRCERVYKRTAKAQRDFLRGSGDRLEVVDETTLIIHYPAPYYAYLADFCWPDVMIIVSPTVFIEGDYMNFSGISGTGPYAFDHRESGQYTRFVRNEDYWGDAPYYDEIVVKYIPESTSRIQALQNGEIDMIFGSALLSYDEYVQVTAMDGMAGQISESDTRVRDLVVNASRPLLTDLKVRQAIAYAIDKESLSENLTYGYEKAAELPFTEDSPYSGRSPNL